jgi:hypothetical protein
VRISGTFQATSAFQYLIIGNFSDDQETQSIFDGRDNDHYYGYAYYFIEDVSVEKLPYSNFTFSGKQTICDGDSTTIFANAGVDNVTWTALPDTTTIIHTGYSFKTKPAITTSYRVKATNCHLTIIDTVTLIVNPLPKINLGRDTTICDGTSLLLDAGAGYSQYKWQDNSNKEFLTAKLNGKYSVTVQDKNGCKAAAEINVALTVVPKVDLGRDTLLCHDFFPLRAGPAGASHQWQDNSTDSVFIPTMAGKYWVVVSYSCGKVADTINIYSLTNLFIPNVLTLNEDTLNQKFRFTGISENYNASLTIVNRWGSEIYFSNNYNGDWPAPNQWPESGVYYYILSFTGCEPYKGWLLILR